MVQQRGRKGGFVGRSAGRTANHFRPLTMFEGIAALPRRSPLTYLRNRKVREIAAPFAGETELLFV